MSSDRRDKFNGLSLTITDKSGKSNYLGVTSRIVLYCTVLSHPIVIMLIFEKLEGQNTVSAIVIDNANSQNSNSAHGYIREKEKISHKRSNVYIPGRVFDQKRDKKLVKRFLYSI